jgi:rsbT co-antagonist protein RsbR
VIQLWDGLLLVPMVGSLDAEQAELATERILTAMSSNKAGEVLLELTGLERADDQLARRLDAIARAVRIMGGTARLSGLSAEMSWRLARLDLGVSHLQTSTTSSGALVRALAALGFEVQGTR